MNRTPEQIRTFLKGQVQLWNDNQTDAMLALYHQIVPGKLSVEYIGIPPMEGWAALDDMCKRWAGKVRIDCIEVMVTGNEAACYHHNTTVGDGTPPRPSIELYKFDGDDLTIRYFHAAKI